MNLAIIIAARLDSSRLPGKTLLDISGRPALGLLLERLRQSESGDHIIVATTDRATDDPIAELAHSYNVQCFRGNSFDLIDRYANAMDYFDIDIAVRVTADCPFVNGNIVSMAVREFNLERKKQGRLLVTTKGIMPVGLDVEVFDRESLAFLQTRPDLSVSTENTSRYTCTSVPSFSMPSQFQKNSNSMMSLGHYTSRHTGGFGSFENHRAKK